jgi:hypothetical protein
VRDWLRGGSPSAPTRDIELWDARPYPGHSSSPEHPSGGPPRSPGRWASADGCLLVVDCTRDGRGTQVVRRLAEAGVACVRAPRAQPDRPLLLLVPICADADAGPPATAQRLEGDLESLVGMRSGPTPVVVAWFLEDGSRQELALPDGRGEGRSNSMALMLGTAWQRELVVHRDDIGAAVRCRSRRLRRMLDAPNNQSVGMASPGSVHASAEELDPRFVVCSATQVVAPTADGVVETLWTGEAGIVAAVVHRLAEA